MKTAPDFDIVIIGAGIHGAGVAQAAAAAGYSALVLEQYAEPAQATSSKSSKLIHGGLRYLESGQFHLVYECLQERENLLRNAPHLVRLVPFHIPIYRETTRRPWKIWLGLLLYSMFSRKRFHRVPPEEWNQLDGLKTEGLDAVFAYYDAQTDDAWLTRSVLASAKQLGAEIITAATFTQAKLVENSCEITFQHDAGHEAVTAGVIVNAAGPWVNNVLDKIEPSPTNMEIDLVQGTHIIVPGTVSHPYYLESPKDRRAVFVMPWKNQVLIGTTENDYQSDPANVCPLDSEINYLLEIYNHYYAKQLTPRDVIGAFTGLRVLPGGEGAAFNKSRDTHLCVDRPARPRLVSIYGGKLTSYRWTSEKLLNRLAKALPKRKRLADTRFLKLPVVE